MHGLAQQLKFCNQRQANLFTRGCLCKRRRYGAFGRWRFAFVHRTMMAQLYYIFVAILCPSNTPHDIRLSYKLTIVSGFATHALTP
jgi:hypothetical protein